MHQLSPILLLLLATVFACKTQRKDTDALKMYIEQCFDSVRVYSIYSENFDLDSLEREFIGSLHDTASIATTFSALQDVLRSMDKHAYLLSQSNFEKLAGGDPSYVPNPYPFQGKMIHEKYAFVSLEGFLGVDSLSAKTYTDSLQNLLVHLYEKNPNGWIIDLRTNTGGWIYPMLAGLGPLLGEGVKAMEIDRNGKSNEYFYFKTNPDQSKEGSLLSDSSFVFDRQLPTVVFIGENTASAGELVALSFRGNPRTVLMGVPSFGVTTGTHGFFMPDSTQVVVSHSVMADRFGKSPEGGKIQPEMHLETAIELFENAYHWIDNHSME